MAGHNNRVDALILGGVMVNGHNNRFTNLAYSQKEDYGICNQFADC